MTYSEYSLFKLTLLATLAPPCHSRSWQTAPHPYLPLVATASSDQVVRIYSLTTFAQQSQITGGHKRSVRAVAWKPGLHSDPESVLATGSFDATAGIWKGENRKRRIGGTVLPRSSPTVHLGDGLDSDDEVASQEAGADEPLDSGDEDDYTYSVQLTGHDSEIKSLTWSPHGTFLATCSRDKSVWVWECLPDEEDNFETLAVLQEHEGDVKCVSWHPSDERCLASGSYDEMLRIWREDVEGEWTCVGVGEGHAGTVWCIAWEPLSHMERMARLTISQDGAHGSSVMEGVKANTTDSQIALSGPRIISCSDDLTIRTWRRRPKPPPEEPQGPRMPSIIRSTSDEEDWYEEQQLPKIHDRVLYAIAWSERTGRVVSCSSDGKIVVYEEQLKHQAGSTPSSQDTAPTESNDANMLKTEWHIIATLEAAHGVFEVNHVCWALRYDKSKRSEDEEVVVSTGDDGEVNVWALDDAHPS